MNTSVNELLSNPAFRPLVLLDVLAVFLMIICLVFRRMRKGYYVEQANDARKATMLKEASQRPVEKSEAVEQAIDNAGGFDLDEWRKAHAPESVPDRRPWFFKTVMGARACMPADEGHPDPSPRRMALAGRHWHAAEPAGAIRLLHGPAAVVIESSQWMLLAASGHVHRRRPARFTARPAPKARLDDG